MASGNGVVAAITDDVETTEFLEFFIKSDCFEFARPPPASPNDSELARLLFFLRGVAPAPKASNTSRKRKRSEDQGLRRKTCGEMYSVPVYHTAVD